MQDRGFRRYQRERIIAKRVARAIRAGKTWPVPPGKNDTHDWYFSCPDGKHCMVCHGGKWKIPDIKDVKKSQSLDADLRENLDLFTQYEQDAYSTDIED
jgi:hypothetical protein